MLLVMGIIRIIKVFRVIQANKSEGLLRYQDIKDCQPADASGEAAPSCTSGIIKKT